MSQKNGHIQFDIDVKKWLFRLFVAVLLIELTIVFFDVFLNHYEWIKYRALRRSVNITREDALGNWWSSTQSMMVGVTLFLLYLRTRTAPDADKRRWERRGWGLLSAFFVYMAIDDAIKLHERIGTSFQEMAEEIHGEESLFSVFPSYSWQVVFGPVLVAMGIFLVWFLWRHLKTRSRRIGMLAAFTCLAVAVIMDLIEGMDEDIPAMSVHAVEHFMKVVEEFLEMLGNSFFLVIFLAQLTSGLERVQVDLRGTADTSST